MRALLYILVVFLLAVVVQTARGADEIHPPTYYRFEENR